MLRSLVGSEMCIRDRSRVESIDRSSPKGSPIDFRSSRAIDRALRDPRSTFDRVDRSIEPWGIPDRSSRSSPKGSPIDRALRDPRQRVEVGSCMRQHSKTALFDGFLRGYRGFVPGQTLSAWPDIVCLAREPVCRVRQCLTGQRGCLPGETMSPPAHKVVKK